MTYPSAPPVGEVAGGKFTAIFNNILQSGNYATDTTGKVKLATHSDLATNVPWTGVTGKPTIVSAETDPQVGTLNAGKWCTSDGSSVNCTSVAPTSGGTGCPMIGWYAPQPYTQATWATIIVPDMAVTEFPASC